MPEPENPTLGPVPTLEQLLIEPGRAGGLPLDAVAAFLTQCAALQAALAARIVTALTGEPPDQKGALLVDTKPPSEYLSIRELAARIPYTEGKHQEADDPRRAEARGALRQAQGQDRFQVERRT